ncbi:MAG: hypothetical protein QNJ64_11915 [Crocosphaera sp.]|nr:hypothetical protein [Crocosphaera sp.]
MIPEIRCQVSSNSQLTLQLNLTNSSQEILLFRPTLEDWVIDNEVIISSVINIYPFFTVIPSQQTIQQTLVLKIPANLQPGKTLNNWLRFPGVQEVAIPLYLLIVPPSNLDNNNENFSLSLSIELPIIREDPNLDPIINLMSGIIDLDKIPSRWLVAELCVKLYQIGEIYCQSSQGEQLLKQLKSTDFLVNGITTFSSLKIPEWILTTINNIHKILPCEAGESHLLYVWESWLFSLDETNHNVPKFIADDYVSQMGLSSEKWFSNLILGLAKLFPKIEERLREIKPLKSSQLNPNKTNINFNNLLFGLDLIPVRWLAVEMLVKIAYRGETSLQKEEEKKLLSVLNSSSFFVQGNLAFASAKIPRWIDISYSAITAYYHSLGLENSHDGLLYVAEAWLWNLSPNALPTRSITQPIDLDIFIKGLGMDETRWWIAIIFGLKQLCPRIEQSLQNIAQQTEKLIDKTRGLPSNYNDVIKESGSIQR